MTPFIANFIQEHFISTTTTTATAAADAATNEDPSQRMDSEGLSNVR